MVPDPPGRSSNLRDPGNRNLGLLRPHGCRNRRRIGDICPHRVDARTRSRRQLPSQQGRAALLSRGGRPSTASTPSAYQGTVFGIVPAPRREPFAPSPSRGLEYRVLCAEHRKQTDSVDLSFLKVANRARRASPSNSRGRSARPHDPKPSTPTRVP